MKPTHKVIFAMMTGIILLVTTHAFDVRADVEKLFVVTTDYETGGCAELNPNSFSSSIKPVTIFQDAIARSYGDKIYVIERWHGDNILVFQKDNLHRPVIQFSVGNGTNPHDFLLIDDTKAYVTLYEKSDLIIVNPKTGNISGKIDLSSFADSDGIPEMDQMIYYGDKVFVSIQRLDRNNLFQPAGVGQIVVIDPSTDSIVDTDLQQPGIQPINLTLMNPIDMQYVTGSEKILVAEAGSFYTAGDGGFEFFDPKNFLTEGIIMTEMDIGGIIGGAIGAFSMINLYEGYAIIMTEDWLESRLVRFNFKTRSAYPVHAPGTGFVHADTLIIDDRLFLCDRTMQNPGIRIFNTKTDAEITNLPIDVGLPPFCLVPVEADSLGDNDTAPLTNPSDPDNETSTKTGLYGRQFVTVVFSPSLIPVFNDVFIFNDDGSFVSKKFEQYGNGDFYAFTPNLFYFIFNTGSGTNIQYIQGIGIFLDGFAGQMILGLGSFMLDYNIVPLAFTGINFFQRP